eukprot:CAMPEP_0198737530 /NCGR_PEP_ID=MMETSP1475-20131203/67914_1 /TAXON_ID= ORGANISM="Unidentified sp., Strain CCMP1999" /NCGR_SAMPLE_ID=MMETSP1475 /ASSEMBLY_ACC=CAM_ASM_001111 /LENGTH=129 /DNA_ID=CAMNT_0044501397 /DNA_START=51 /DNA_END=440 /DNA_ORIENTATION=+
MATAAGGKMRREDDFLSPTEKRKIRRELLAEKRLQAKPVGIQKQTKQKNTSTKEDLKDDEAAMARVLRSRELAMKARQKKKDHFEHLQSEISELQRKASDLETENKKLIWQVKTLFNKTCGTGEFASQL